jgi:hypothetical protein
MLLTFPFLGPYKQAILVAWSFACCKHLLQTLLATLGATLGANTYGANNWCKYLVQILGANTITHTYTQLHIHTHKYTYIHTITRTYTQLHIHTHKYTYIHTSTHTYTQVHIHAHVCTRSHTQALQSWSTACYVSWTLSMKRRWWSLLCTIARWVWWHLIICADWYWDELYWWKGIGGHYGTRCQVGVVASH